MSETKFPKWKHSIDSCGHLHYKAPMGMATPTIFEYRDPYLYLLDYFNFRKASEPSFSLRAWSRTMGLKGHTLLMLLIQKKRRLRVQHASFLGLGMDLNAQENLYLQALIQFYNAKSPEEKSLCLTWMADLLPSGQVANLDRSVCEFRTISHWIHTAILAMTYLERPLTTAGQFAECFHDEFSLTEIRAAIERLEILGLLRLIDGRYQANIDSLSSKNDFTDLGAQKYHQEVLSLASKKISTTLPSDREYQSFSMSIRQEDLPVAQKMIRKFRAKFSDALNSQKGNGVYQFSIQFFPLFQDSPVVRQDDEELSNVARDPQSRANNQVAHQPPQGKINHEH